MTRDLFTQLCQLAGYGYFPGGAGDSEIERLADLGYAIGCGPDPNQYGTPTVQGYRKLAQLAIEKAGELEDA